MYFQIFLIRRMEAKVLLGWEREYSIHTRPSAGVATDIERAVYAIYDDFDENEGPRFSRSDF